MPTDSIDRAVTELNCYNAHMNRWWPTADEKRLWMLDGIRNEAQLCSRYTGRARLSARVLQVMGNVPRHLFVPRSARIAAYDNSALSVGCGQTISQPFIVALMTDLLDLSGSERVLEIGTGTGYQTAVLSSLAAEVYSVEYLPELLTKAKQRLLKSGCENIHLHQGNGWLGWPQHAPYDAIIVTAAPDHVPEPLLDQLANSGRLVIPVGPEGQAQELLRIEKNADGTVSRQSVLPVVFVPMVGTENAQSE